MKDRTDLVGTRIGRWKVLGISDRSRPGNHYYDCECDCGTKRAVAERSLRTDAYKQSSRSCGCLSKETLSSRATTHGETNAPEFALWQSMIKRCNHDRRYKEIVFVCERWSGDNGYVNFLADMGRMPVVPGVRYTLDRFPDQRGNYEKSNCRWATYTEQARNRTNNSIIPFMGLELTQIEWALRTGIPRDTIAYRLRSNWSIERTLTEPVAVRSNNRQTVA